MSQAVIDFARALDFAARKHTHQRRKGKAAEPYVNHLTEVAYMLAKATQGSDPELVMCGLLHDTVEDTETTVEEIEREFGPEVASVVSEVTDDKTLSKAERKRLQVETAPKKSRRAKMVKLADKTSNLRAIVRTPPADWTLERKRQYLEWAYAVAAGCRGVNRQLELWFDEAYTDGLERLGGLPESTPASPEPAEADPPRATGS